ncbi:hypothetical protein [Geodermatophilus chilensis]|uniref:hypothetical protein n=1 Tax=Geodermatophilus chilensis TaxID=2035835 RepID=UPI0012FFD944|nr:hypothetical protein [Geodermatophilus chilensis]
MFGAHEVFVLRAPPLTVFFTASVVRTLALSPEVRVREVAGESGADVVVNDLVRVAVPVDADDTSLGLAVLVVPQLVCHVLFSFLGRWSR